jgi:hypothetical protein
MPILGEGGMIGDIAVEPEPAEPPVGQIEVDLFAETPLGADTEAVPDDEHADHQLGINRWPSQRAVERRELAAQFRQVDKAVDRLDTHLFEPARLHDAGIPAASLRSLQDAASSRIAWVLGYVTGFNQYGSKPEGDVTGGKGTEEIMTWIDNYCGRHPGDNLYRASAALVDELRQNIGR